MSKPIRLKGTERILVVRTDRIGDLVLATPVFECLKRSFPNLAIDALVSDCAKPVLENNPSINQVIPHHRTNSANLLRKISGERYDLCILLYPRFRLAWLLFRAGVPHRIGTAFRWYSFLFTHKIFQHRKTVEKHELEYNLEMLLPLGISSQSVQPRIYLSKTETETVEVLFKQNRLSPPDLKIVIHPGGGRSSLRWGEDRFAQLATLLREKLSAKIILTGVETERDLTGIVAQRLAGEVIDLTGKLSLRELAAVLSKSDLIVTNSTGPMHIAAALGVKVLALFCPIKTASPRRWGPYGTGHQVLLPPVDPCRCSVANCRRNNCMELISVEEVFQKVGLLLSKGKTGVQNR